MKELENKLFANELALFANELALKKLESAKRLMNIADDNPDYLQEKHNIEEAFERHKLEYKELTGDDYVNKLNHNMFE